MKDVVKGLAGCRTIVIDFAYAYSMMVPSECMITPTGKWFLSRKGEIGKLSMVLIVLNGLER
jgi:hypothetical protein